jgi:hypothetical protein
MRRDSIAQPAPMNRPNAMGEAKEVRTTYPIANGMSANRKESFHNVLIINICEIKCLSTGCGLGNGANCPSITFNLGKTISGRRGKNNANISPKRNRTILAIKKIT